MKSDSQFIPVTMICNGDAKSHEVADALNLEGIIFDVAVVNLDEFAHYTRNPASKKCESVILVRSNYYFPCIVGSIDKIKKEIANLKKFHSSNIGLSVLAYRSSIDAIKENFEPHFVDRKSFNEMKK